MAGVRAVIVSYGDPAATGRAVASLRAQREPPSEIVVVDNHPDRRVEAIEGARVIWPGANLGYTGGANLGARGAAEQWLLFLNPDAVAAPGCLGRLLAAATPEVGIVGAQVLLPDGTVNAGHNPLHVTGLSWSGALGQPAEDGPPREVAVVSGAALLVRREAWERVGGLTERFFLYQDDTDLCWRARLAGWRVVFQPAAHATHDYNFDKGREKWFYLERNRAWTVLTGYSARALLLLAPLLLATEAAVALRALREGWWREKARAWVAVLVALPALARRRREVQALRAVGDGTLLALTTGRFEATLAPSGAARAAGPLMERYRRMVVRALG